MSEAAVKIERIRTFGDGVQAFRIVREQPLSNGQFEQEISIERTRTAELLGEKLWQQVSSLSATEKSEIPTPSERPLSTLPSQH